VAPAGTEPVEHEAVTSDTGEPRLVIWQYPSGVYGPALDVTGVWAVAGPEKNAAGHMLSNIAATRSMSLLLRIIY
jgi:hypothetical protein